MNMHNLTVKEQDFWNKHYSSIVGGTVEEFILYKDDYDEYWPMLIIKDSTGQILQVDIDCDPEGNGAGFLRIAKLNIDCNLDTKSE